MKREYNFPENAERGSFLCLQNVDNDGFKEKTMAPPSISEIEDITHIDEKYLKMGHKGKVEENVKIKLIVPLLKLLNYNVVTDLDFETNVRNKFADIAVVIDDKPRISIECKDLSENLDNHLEQAFKYAVWKGFHLLVLTNGIEIRVYRTWEFGTELEDRLLLSENISNLSNTIYNDKGLWELLSKENITIQVELYLKWNKIKDKLPILSSYITGLFDFSVKDKSFQCLINEAFNEINLYNYSEAITRLRQCMNLDIKNERIRVFLHIHIANCFYFQDRYIETLGALFEGLRITEEHKYPIQKMIINGVIGNVYLRQGNAINAEKYLILALNDSKELGSDVDYANQLGNYSHLLENKGLIYEAMEMRKEILRIFKSKGNENEYFKTISNIAMLHYHLSDYKKSIDLLVQGKNYFEKNDFKRSLVLSFKNLGVLHYTMNDYKTALMYYHKGLTISKEIENIREEAGFYLNIGLILSNKGYLPRAEKVFNLALSQFEKIDNQIGIAKMKCALAGIYQKQSQYTKSLKNYNGALKFFKDNGYIIEMSSCYGNIGTVYKCLGEYGKALKFHEEAHKIDLITGNKADESNSLEEIAHIYSKIGNTPKALEMYEETLAIRTEIGNIRGVASSYRNIGIIQKMQNNNQIALKYYDKALKIYEELGNTVEIAEQYGNIANVYKQMKEFEMALEYSFKALKIFKEKQLPREIAMCNGNIGVIYLDIDDFNKAEEFIICSKEIYEKIDDKSGIATQHANLGYLNKKKGELPEALDCFKEALQIFSQIEALSLKEKIAHEIKLIEEL